MQKLKIYSFADEASASIDGQISAMKRNGLDGLEIRGVDGQSIADISIEKAREVRAKLDARGLAVWSVGSPIGKIGITDDFAPHLDQFKHVLELADVLGAGNIRVFSFYIPRGEAPEQYKTRVLDRMGAFLEVAKGTGITLCHENEKGIFGDTAARCLLLHRALPALQGIFDPANYVQCDVDTRQAWDLLKNYIKYLHIKDAKNDHRVVPAGYGAGNVEYIVKDYIKNGGSVVTIEPHLAVFEGLAALEKEGEVQSVPEFAYPDTDAAFDAACTAFKALL